MTKRRHWLFYALLILIIIILIIALLFSCGKKTDSGNYDSNAIVWDGEKRLPQPTVDGKPGIATPGFSELVFISNQYEQQVNFYNPQVNNCDFKMLLYADGELLWESEMVEPGKGFHDIEINKKLPSGEYEGKLSFQCYRNNERISTTPSIKFNLIVIDN